MIRDYTFGMWCCNKEMNDDAQRRAYDIDVVMTRIEDFRLGSTALQSMIDYQLNTVDATDLQSEMNRRMELEN